MRAVVTAESLLRDALHGARLANCPKLAAAILYAIASANGAKRHARHRLKASRPVLGVLHVTRTDRQALANIEQPVRRFAWMNRKDCGT